MKNLIEIAENYQPGGNKLISDQPEKLAVPEQAVIIVNELFVKLKSIFPAWTNAFPNADLENYAKREWITSFIENKVLHTKQINLGLIMARKSKAPWFPSVGTFIDWCKPSLEKYGLLPAHKALRVAINGNKSKCPVINLAILATGRYELRNMRHEQLLKLFTHNYEIACQRMINGENLIVELPKALPKEVYVVSSQATALDHIKKIKNSLKKGSSACH